MNGRTMGMCRRLRRRHARNAGRSSMSSYPYSPPEIPIRSTILDMLVFYATPAVRERMIEAWPEDANLLDDLVEEVIGLVETWRPTTEWHLLSVVRTDRTLEWMVWQVATSIDEDLVDLYRSEAIIPFAIDLDTLPRYGRPPTVLVPPEE